MENEKLEILNMIRFYGNFIQRIPHKQRSQRLVQIRRKALRFIGKRGFRRPEGCPHIYGKVEQSF